MSWVLNLVRSAHVYFFTVALDEQLRPLLCDAASRVPPHTIRSCERSARGRLGGKLVGGGWRFVSRSDSARMRSRATPQVRVPSSSHTPKSSPSDALIESATVQSWLRLAVLRRAISPSMVANSGAERQR